MPTFRYFAYGVQGQYSEGQIEAISPEAASELLWTQGLTPFRLDLISHAAGKWWQRDLFSKSDPSPAELASFTRELATLMSAEIPLDDALRILCDQSKSAQLKLLAAKLRADIVNGLTLSDAMQQYAKVFPLDYVSTIRAGEIGGTVGMVVEELADLLDRRLDTRERIRSALVYPALLMGLAAISLATILGTLIPSIATIFASSGRQPPAVVRLVLTVQAHWPEIIAIVGLTSVSLISSGIVLLRRPGGRAKRDRVLLRLPIWGQFTLQQETARFARTLGTLLRAGVPLLQASTSSHSVLRNKFFAAQINEAIDLIREGSTLQAALEVEAVIPALALRMIAIGEEAGKLDRMLVRVAVIFEQQTQRTVERFMTILTPLLTIAMAAIVGILLMTVMGAVTSMNELGFQ